MLISYFSEGGPTSRVSISRLESPKSKSSPSPWHKASSSPMPGRISHVKEWRHRCEVACLKSGSLLRAGPGLGLGMLPGHTGRAEQCSW